MNGIYGSDASMPRRLARAAIALFALCLPAPMLQAQQQSARDTPIATRSEIVDGVKLNYLTAGAGPAIVLLHGYAETSRMWRPLIPTLAEHFTVVAPDLPGIGDSAIPSDGLDIVSAAARIHALATALGIDKAQVVGHDIGLMVAYSYAAQFPSQVEKLVLMDAFLPGVGNWRDVYDNPSLWHFRFSGPTPEALVKGRERAYFDYYWNGFAADARHSLPEADREAYAAAYARPNRMRAAWAYFASFPRVAENFAERSKTKLPMPVLVIGGDRANGAVLAKQVGLVASRGSAVILPNTGHWLMEENREGTIAALTQFLSAPASSLPASRELRLTPTEASQRRFDAGQAGTSALDGVRTEVLLGDPSRPGFYTILIFVPANTTIQAHSHRDDRMAVVVSGSWRFGYGNRFDERVLEALPAGSVYSEPGGTNHFARTDAEPAVVEISGYGPTDTHYVATAAAGTK
ncbi:MAG TPA: alpha/beta fold hydrolase [Gammaproteobacteria bacterium]|nr:alpha/beta fold hydrolase [Gammaproteobacteria bacterium]